MKAHRLLYHSTLGLRVIKKNRDVYGEPRNTQKEIMPTKLVHHKPKGSPLLDTWKQVLSL